MGFYGKKLFFSNRCRPRSEVTQHVTVYVVLSYYKKTKNYNLNALQRLHQVVPQEIFKSNLSKATDIHTSLKTIFTLHVQSSKLRAN